MTIDDAEPKAFLWPCKGLEDEPGLFQGHHTVLLTSFFRTWQYHNNVSTLGQKSRCIYLTKQDTAKLRVFLKSPQNFASDKPLTNRYEHSSLAGYLVLDAKIDESGDQPWVQEGNLSML